MAATPSFQPIFFPSAYVRPEYEMGTSKMRSLRARKPRGDLGFEPEPVRREAEGARDVAAYRLVAGLHVGEVEVREHVAERGEAEVADGVPEVEHPVRAAEEAGAEDRVGPAVDDRLEQCRASRRGRTRGRRPGRSRRCRCSRRARCGWRRPCRGSRRGRSACRCVPRPSAAGAISRVPSLEQSSTQMISFRTGTACTWSRISSMVARSLYTGTSTESRRADGAMRRASAQARERLDGVGRREAGRIGHGRCGLQEIMAKWGRRAGCLMA